MRKATDFPLERYNQYMGNPRGLPYEPTQCAAEIWTGKWKITPVQCSRGKGHGFAGLFCKQHAKKYPSRNV